MVETKFKQTDVEIKSLGEIGAFVRGNGLQKKDFTDSGIPCIHYGQVHTHYSTFIEKTISFVSFETSLNLRKAKKGDIIIVCTSENVEDVGKCVVWLGEDDVCVGGETYIYSHNQDAKYLAYYFQTDAFTEFKKRNFTGTKVCRLHENELKTFEIPLPSLEEQERIASALTSIDNLISSLDKQIAKTRNIKQGAMRQLLTFPDNVPLRPLEMICEALPNKTLKTTQLNDNGYPVVNSSRDFYGYYSNFNNEGNAFTFASRGEYAGFVTYVEERFWAGGLCYPYKSKGECLYMTKFIYYYLKVVEKSIMEDLVERGSIPALNKSDVNNIPIPVPSIEEQQRIASTLTAMDNQIATLEAKRRKYEMLKQGMMQQLLTGKIRLSQ